MSFERDLEKLVQDEVRRSVRVTPARTAERLAEMMAELITAAGYCIAIGVRGDTKAADTLLTGSQNFLAEAVAAQCIVVRATMGPK